MIPRSASKRPRHLGRHPCATETLEPRRLLAVTLQNEGVAVPPAPNEYFFPYANWAFFAASTADGIELWENNGGPGQTHTSGVEGVPGPGSTNPRDLALLRNRVLPGYEDVYITGDDPSAPGSRAIYKRDANTAVVSRLRTFRSVDQLVAVNATTIVFAADGGDGAGKELWKTDGTPAGTERISDIAPGAAGASIGGMTASAFNGKVLFSAADGTAGAELWTSDGTAAGTVMVKDINPGPADGAPRDFFQTGLQVHFNATTAGAGSELWVSDGTNAGTAQVADALPGPSGSGLTPVLTTVDQVYSFTRGDVPLELYKTNKTTGQTTLVKRVSDQPVGARTVRAQFLYESVGGNNDVFVFGAADAATGLEPWRSDGTAAGTYLIKDVNPGPAGSLDPAGSFASVWGNRAFFAATDGRAGPPLLWTTTGTAAGTVPATGTGGRLAYNPTNVVAAARNAFFAASAAPDAGAPRTFWIAGQNPEVPTVSGAIYHDLDANSLRDPGDPGIAGVTVYADFDGDASPDAGEPMVRTGDDGTYTLPLEVGTYTIRFVVPAGYVASSTSAQVVNLTPNSVFAGLNFGAHTTGDVQITAFDDLDANRRMDPGEAPLEGRTVYLDANNNDRLDVGEPTRVTGADGVARFQDLSPAAYLFDQVVPAGWVDTGDFAAPGISVTVRSGATAAGVLGSRQPTATGAVTGTVYEDVNVSRLRDAGDRGVEGRVVFADTDHDGVIDDGESSTTSGAGGVYVLTVPAGGTYDIRQVVPPGWTPTEPNGPDPAYLSVHINANGGGTPAGPFDFGSVNVPPATVSGDVYLDANANGVRDPGETTDSGGTVYLDLNNDGRVGSREPYTAVGADGRYAIRNVTPGSYTVRLNPIGGFQTDPGWDDRGRPLGRSITVAAGQDVAGVNFGVVSQTLAGTVTGLTFDDTNGNGAQDGGERIAPGRVVYIDANNNGALDAGERRYVTETSSYVFSALPPGTYTVRAVTPEGYRQTLPPTPGGAYTVTLAARQTASNINFGFTPAGTASAISGRVYGDANGSGRRDAGEPARSGTVYLDTNNDGVRQTSEPSASVTTSSGGFYSFTGLAPGTYAVRHVTSSTDTLTQPSGGAYTVNLGTNQLSGDNDFGLVQTAALGYVTGSVFEDTNGNGVYDTASERVRVGAVAYLDADNDGALDAGEKWAMVTETGGYRINSVFPGTYTLRVVVPPGYTQTRPAGGAGQTLSVLIDRGTTAPSAFGLAPSANAASVSGTVYHDGNGNGTRDAADLPMSNRIVYVDADNDGQFDPGSEPATRSNEVGGYTLRGLLPGTHVLRQELIPGYVQTEPAGRDANDLPLGRAVTVAAGQAVTGVNLGSVHGSALARLTGVVFHDADRDGVQDTGGTPGSPEWEPGQNGWRVYLDANNNGALDAGERVSTTTSTGTYTFLDLVSGTYNVRTLPPVGWENTAVPRPSRTVTVNPASTTRVDLPTVIEAGDIVVTAFNDLDADGTRDAGEPPLAGWQLHADADRDGVVDPGEFTFQTDANGRAVMNDVIVGTVRIGQLPPAGWRVTTQPGNYVDVTVTAGQQSQVVFGNTTRAPTESVTLSAAADAYVRDGTSVDTKYGTSAELLVKKSSAAGLQRETYLRFDLSQVSAAERAILRLYGGLQSDSGETVSVGVYPSGNVTWPEADVTWNTKPAAGTTALDTEAVSGTAPRWYEWDVTDYVRQQKAAGATAVTLVLKGVANSTAYVRFNSDEAADATTRPQLVVDSTPADRTAPTVADIVVLGSAWPQSFLAALAAQQLGDGGYAVPQRSAGAPRTVPWGGVDTVVVRFSEHVLVQAGDLRVLGAGGAYAVRDFRYDPSTFTATWVLATPFGADRVRLEVEGDAPDGVTDAAGNRLRGLGPDVSSGDHVVGFNALPGDATGDGVVNALDLAYARQRLGKTSSDGAAYSVFADLTGDGRVNALDLAAVRQRLGRRLP